jgi:hypothetical protein
MFAVPVGPEPQGAAGPHDGLVRRHVAYMGSAAYLGCLAAHFQKNGRSIYTSL